MKWSVRKFAWLAVFAAAACTDVTNPAARPAEPDSPEARSAAEQVSRGVALALREAPVRAEVREALRRSPVTEHKLVFQQFLATPAGTRLAGRAAAGLGVDRADFAVLVAHLPEMDFYVPSRAQRLAWTGGSTVTVAAVLDNDHPITAGYTPEGRRVAIDTRALRPADALFVLEPAERKSRRVDAQPADRPGTVIQDPDDGELSGSYGWVTPAGDTVEFELADVLPGGAKLNVAPGTGAADTTYLEEFYVTFCDTGADCTRGNEVEFRASFYARAGESRVDYKFYRQEGVSSINHDAGGVETPHAVQIFQRLLEGSTTELMEVNLVETDFGSDDNYGNVQVRAGNRNQVVEWPDYGGQACGGVSGCYVAGAARWNWTPLYSRSGKLTVTPSPAGVAEGLSVSLAARYFDGFGVERPGQATTWSSADPAVAVVSSTGVVTGVAVGRTTIYATANGVTSSAEFTVTPPDVCAAVRAGTHCGVNVSYSHYYTPTAFGRGFQGVAGTGLQPTITINFSPAVSAVTVTALDPDFSGNRMVAYNGTTQVGTVYFDGDGTPGQTHFTTSTKTVTANTITRVQLIPDPSDYVAWDAAGFSCRATAKSSTACGVTVTFSQYYTPTAWNRGFQAVAGTGLQPTINGTFSTAVRRVMVTALDPDFINNRVEAYNGTSLVAASYFSGDNTPGVFTTDTRMVTSGAITRAALTPDSGDYTVWEEFRFLR